MGYVCGIMAMTYGLPSCLLFALAVCAFGGRCSALFACACFAMGLLAGGPVGTAEHSPAWNATARVRGVVEEVRTHPGRRVSILARDVVDTASNATLPGGLLWTWADPPAIPEAGCSFEATLRISELRGRANFGLSSNQERWLREGVRHRAFTYGAASVTWGRDEPSVRARLVALADSALPAGQGGAVLRALLFGDRLLLDPAFMDRIRRAGLSHSLALSGLHLSLAASFGLGLAMLAGRLMPGILTVLPRRKLGILLSLPAVLAYLWMGAFTPSLMRAALMLCAVALHLLRGARSHPQDCLFAAAALLVIPDPSAAHDLSLQLSFLAVGGIILFMPTASAMAGPAGGTAARRLLRALVLLAAGTVCANLFILPVQVLYFAEVPAHLWLNLLWLPVLSFAVLPLSFAGLAAAPFWPLLAAGLFGLAATCVEGLDACLVALDGRGWLQAWSVLRPDGVEVVGYWSALVAGLLSGGRSRARPLAFLGLGLSLMAAPALLDTVLGVRPKVELTVLDTGMSQAVSVRGPSGAMVLVDGAGGWGTDYDPGRALVAPALAWRRPPRVGGVVLTHVDADHARGLFHVLEAFDVAWFAWSGLSDGSTDSRRLGALLERRLWPQRVVRAGDRLDIEPGLWLEVLHPGGETHGLSDNDSSLVMRLVWQGRGLALLPGDAERHALEKILRSGVDVAANVLILPHHGSRSSLSPRLYDEVGAEWAVAACGPGNRFGFPHRTVREACEAAGSRVLTTAQSGAIRFEWDSAGLHAVRCARPDACP